MLPSSSSYSIFEVSSFLECLTSMMSAKPNGIPFSFSLRAFGMFSISSGLAPRLSQSTICFALNDGSFISERSSLTSSGVAEASSMLLFVAVFSIKSILFYHSGDKKSIAAVQMREQLQHSARCPICVFHRKHIGKAFKLKLLMFS